MEKVRSKSKNGKTISNKSLAAINSEKFSSKKALKNIKNIELVDTTNFKANNYGIFKEQKKEKMILSDSESDRTNENIPNINDNDEFLAIVNNAYKKSNKRKDTKKDTKVSDVVLDIIEESNEK